MARSICASDGWIQVYRIHPFALQICIHGLVSLQLVSAPVCNMIERMGCFGVGWASIGNVGTAGSNQAPFKISAHYNNTGIQNLLFLKLLFVSPTNHWGSSASDLNEMLKVNLRFWTVGKKSGGANSVIILTCYSHNSFEFAPWDFKICCILWKSVMVD